MFIQIDLAIGKNKLFLEKIEEFDDRKEYTPEDKKKSDNFENEDDENFIESSETSSEENNMTDEVILEDTFNSGELIYRKDPEYK